MRRPGRTRERHWRQTAAVEVGLGLLEVGLTGRALALIAGHERTDGQLGEGDGGYERLGGQQLCVGDLAK